MILSSVAGHERPRLWVTVGIAGTLAGIVMVIAGRGDAIELGNPTVRGDALILMASLLWSIYTVGGRRPTERYGALRMTAWTLWVGTPFIVLMGVPALTETSLGTVSAGAWLGVAYSGLLAIGLAYLLWYRGVQRIGNNRTAVYSNLVPVAALITAWVWLGEVPTSLQLLGAGVILGGLTVARLAHSPDVSRGR